MNVLRDWLDEIYNIYLSPLQGLTEINPKARELEESNALALAIVPAEGKK